MKGRYEFNNLLSKVDEKEKSSQLELGVKYYTGSSICGFNIEQNKAKGIMLIRKAAENGNIEAQRYLNEGISIMINKEYNDIKIAKRNEKVRKITSTMGSYDIEKNDILSQLPPGYRDGFSSSIIPFIKIIPLPGEAKLWKSKYLGHPYQPKGDKYPIGEGGRHLVLLAQINFDDVPHLNQYPDTGILQFFVLDDDSDEIGLYGMNYPINSLNETEELELYTKQRNFVVRYFENTITDESKLVTDFSFLPTFDFLPIEKECEIFFQLSKEIVSWTDYRIHNIIGKDFPISLSSEEANLFNECSLEFESSGNKIGGYASISQNDPRYGSPENENWLLLLQIDYADEVGIMWGDEGAGQFFIRKVDLGSKDFSRVAFFWSCA